MQRIETVLQNYLNALPDSKVKKAMSYSLMAGGKRIRPNLLYEVCKGYGVDEKEADAFACAIEMIHTYSLIHDDLPAMDNDDLRRGRLTCHKQFDEATAILAGDGLLTYAFQVASSSALDASIVQRCIAILARLAGSAGMILGQDLDMNESHFSDWEYVKKVHRYKTGCLLSAPLMMGATLAKQDVSCIEKWHEIGIALGLAFQIQDDILDVELTSEQFGKSNSDARNDKITSVTLLGLQQAKNMMHETYQDVKYAVSQIPNFESKQFIQMVEQIENRRK